MKPVTVLASAAVLAVAASAATAYFLRAEHPAQAAPQAQPVVRPAGLEGELAERLAALERSVAELAARSTLGPSEVRRAPDELERVVRRLLAEERDAAPALAAGATAPDTAGAGARPLPEDPAALLSWLEDPHLGELERQLLWERVRAAGRIDEVVASYEARAQADPNSSQAQVLLANAYLQKLFQLGDGPVKGMVAMQADAAFDRALELDPTHWEARFTKAVSLSHWPPIFGKQSEAIAHFETLVEQQRSLAPQAHHVQSYLLLGNLYLQSGKADRAVATWQEGLAMFPAHPALLEALSKN